jgi:16S rRNA (adenine1518-N6/adenine1519-N6)-dimethyltransferase
LKKPKLGQNFLVDDAACLRIADALGDVTQRTVVEIGPGHGAITTLLAARCARLECVEFDEALVRELRFRFRENPRVTVHHADVLAFDFGKVANAGADGLLDVVGNLPYYITSDILLHLFEAARAGRLRRAVLMMQREVAERIAAGPGVSEYGALSAFTQLHARVEELFTLPPGAFAPSPEVYSTVVRMEFAPRFAELGVEAEGFNRFLRAGFAQKRKTLANNLRAAGYEAAALRRAWPQGVAAQARAEAVGLEAMAELYRSLEAEALKPDGTEAPAS